MTFDEAILITLISGNRWWGFLDALWCKTIKETDCRCQISVMSFSYFNADDLQIIDGWYMISTDIDPDILQIDFVRLLFQLKKILKNINFSILSYKYLKEKMKFFKRKSGIFSTFPFLSKILYFLCYLLSW